jgi:hypothetical protein
MFEMLAVITPFSIIGVVVLIAIAVFVVFPKVKNSKKIDKLTEDMTSSGRSTTTTAAIIDTMSEAKQNLVDKSKEINETIKDATKEGKIVDKLLGKDKKD